MDDLCVCVRIRFMTPTFFWYRGAASVVLYKGPGKAQVGPPRGTMGRGGYPLSLIKTLIRPY